MPPREASKARAPVEPPRRPPPLGRAEMKERALHRSEIAKVSKQRWATARDDAHGVTDGRGRPLPPNVLSHTQVEILTAVFTTCNTEGESEGDGAFVDRTELEQ